jgi:hypothetical protein
VSASAADPAEPDLVVLAGNPTNVELAAVTAVLLGVVQERAFDRSHEDAARPSGWQLSRRPRAVSIVPGPGAWRNISA